jgi:hypothetical protein
MNTSQLIVIFVGVLLLMLVYAIIAAIGALFALFNAWPFLAGLASGAGVAALAGRRILQRNRELEAQNRVLEETVDNFLRQEGAL